MNFSDLNLSSPILTAIEKLGYQTCTPIQEQAIPLLLEGKDVAGLAQTGTGKTAAFLVPLIDRVLRSSQPQSPEVVVEANRTFADWKSFHKILILVPTRELVEQVYENFNQLASETSLKACTIYGGTSYEKQKEALRNNTTFIIATPGRLIDLYKENLIDFKQVRAVVFDEADRMFDMGFKDDMKYLLQRIPQERQFLVFSATLNFDVLNTAYQFGSHPVEINMSKDQTKSENVEDSIFHLGHEDKPAYILSLIKIHKPKQVIIFSNFKNQIESLVQFLRKNNLPALGLSSLITQNQRNRVIQQFKEENPNADENSIQVLVATDVAARGLDIQGVDLVINYEMPQDPESYVHRIGRTGRAGAKGKAFSFVSDRDVDSLVRIEEFLKHKLNVSWLEDEQIIKEFTPFKMVSQYDGSPRGGFAGGNSGERGQGHGRDRDRNYRSKGAHHDKPFKTRTTSVPKKSTDSEIENDSHMKSKHLEHKHSSSRNKNLSHEREKFGDRNKKQTHQSQSSTSSQGSHKKSFESSHSHAHSHKGKKHMHGGKHGNKSASGGSGHGAHSHHSSKKPVLHKVQWWSKVKKFMKSLFKGA